MTKYYITRFFMILLSLKILSKKLKKIDLYLYIIVIPSIFPDTQAPKAISCT